MRADLSDAYAAIEWGESQFPVIAGRFRDWEAANVQLVPVDLNPPMRKMAAVARAKEPLPGVFHAEIGSIIGSFRSALDLLGAAMAARNGKAPSRDTHFPIFRSQQDMIDPLEGIEGKKWLSAAERKIIKSLLPYDGGDDLLWSLHQLDILRKHERLVTCVVNPQIVYAAGRGMVFPSRSIHDPFDLKDEPVLFEFPGDAPQPDAQLSVQVTFNEIGFSAVYRQPLLPTLVDFANLVRQIIGLFDRP